jgi:hypothetical protein
MPAARTRAGIEVAPVLVEVGEHHRRVVLERVEHPIAVVRVDVDVSDALQSRALQQLDRHPAVVEDAKARRALARRVMEPGDGHEGAAALAAHDRLHRA